MKTFLKNKKGFTLTELMIVVVILGILVLIAVPIYNNVTDEAKRSTCDANRRTIESAIVQYSAVEGIELTTEFDADAAYDALVGKYINEWPECPTEKSEGVNHTYTVSVSDDGVVTVSCTNTEHSPVDEEEHG
jgi:prepilin-type N-terminal cleavage/methylation domain-containing protein